MEEKGVGFEFKARYYKLGSLNANTREVWFVLHGYGQLAQYFARKFESLTKQNICVIAPEGLSRYYLSEFTDKGRKHNRVGAVWMTSENRLMDIENYLSYLNKIYAIEMADFSNVPVTLLGFSQGCATVCRWATTGRINLKKLILWAGLFPPDMNFQSGKEILAMTKTFMVAGNEDPFVTTERIKEFDLLAEKLGITPDKIVFEGKHEIADSVFPELIRG
jgi:predicted esterase